MPWWAFIFLGVLALLSALGVIVQRNAVHCLLSLVLTLLTLAVIFIGLDAVTVGLLQAIVYAGAIMVLFLFVIWLLNLQVSTEFGTHLALKFFGAIAAAALVTELVVFFAHSNPHFAPRELPSGYGQIDALAGAMFGRYLIAFEATSILLLVAVVGAVAVASRTIGRRAEQPRAGAA